MVPGIYYVQGGGFSVAGNARVTGTGVILINAATGPGGSICISGSASLTLSPPTNLTGAYAAYNGITLFQDPNSSAPITESGSAVLTMSGILYAPRATLNITGLSSMFVNNDVAHGIGAEVIVYDLLVSSSGGLTINPPTTSASAPASVVTTAATTSNPLLSSAVTSTGGTPSPSTTDVSDAALGTIASKSGSGVLIIADPSVLDDVALSLASDGDGDSTTALGPNGKKPRK
jgi:hypothetical protein